MAIISIFFYENENIFQTVWIECKIWYKSTLISITYGSRMRGHRLNQWWHSSRMQFIVWILHRLYVLFSWWRHQMETFFALLAICAGNSPVPGDFPAQRPVTRSFDVFFDLRLNIRLSKQSWGWWFETPSRPLWRHCNVFKWWSDLIVFFNVTSLSRGRTCAHSCETTLNMGINIT